MALLSPEERAVYEWQMWLPDIGERGQIRLKNSSALVSRCGGLGGPLCYNLAAAGMGRLVLAHGGRIKPSDLNRQILMRADALGTSRVECAARRLREFNPRLTIEAIPENVTEDNVATLVGQVDIVFDCAPLFSERFLLNRECVRQRKPMIEAAMYGLEAQVTTILPGKTPCLACLYPECPSHWKREFPVLAAVPAFAAAVAALEGIKVLLGFGRLLAGRLLYYDGRDMAFYHIPIARRPGCPVCGSLETTF